MRLAITGAGGFVGQAVVRCLMAQGFAGEVLLFDQAFTSPQPYPTRSGDLCDPAVLSELAAADCVMHLAALPGGAAATDPALSRRINLDVTLDLMERLAGKRLIYASSIAVLGGDLREPVDDETPARPDSTYGAHKRMAELGFADAVRRGALSGLAVRLPGVVARPAGASAGFGSGFLSEIFHAARAGAQLTVPVAPQATSWLISAQTCAANLVRAVQAPQSCAEAITMPALRVSMDALLARLALDYVVDGIDHEEQPEVRRAFGSYPPLQTKRAHRLGMKADADIEALVASVFADH